MRQRGHSETKSTHLRSSVHTASVTSRSKSPLVTKQRGLVRQDYSSQSAKRMVSRKQFTQITENMRVMHNYLDAENVPVIPGLNRVEGLGVSSSGNVRNDNFINFGMDNESGR